MGSIIFVLLLQANANLVLAEYISIVLLKAYRIRYIHMNTNNCNRVSKYIHTNKVFYISIHIRVHNHMLAEYISILLHKAYIYIHVDVSIEGYKNICTHMYKYIHIYIYKQVYIHMYICLYI